MVDAPFCAFIRRGSHVTLHYRIAVAVDGEERDVVNTFGAQPATLTIGSAEIAEALENRLLGLAEGVHTRFEVPAGEAFGARRPELIQSFSAATFAASADIEPHAGPGDVVRVTDTAGREFAGVMQQRDADRVIVDFNHPLAGRPLLFLVQVIGVL
jgi:FKBP-type peptidyl-prolyl cis-trans isomerase SlpA